MAYLYRPLHLGVLRMIKSAVARRAGGRASRCAMCGEMAGDPLYALVLLGLGVDELSMNALRFPP